MEILENIVKLVVFFTDFCEYFDNKYYSNHNFQNFVFKFQICISFSFRFRTHVNQVSEPKCPWCKI